MIPPKILQTIRTMMPRARGGAPLASANGLNLAQRYGFRGQPPEIDPHNWLPFRPGEVEDYLYGLYEAEMQRSALEQAMGFTSGYGRQGRDPVMYQRRLFPRHIDPGDLEVGSRCLQEENRADPLFNARGAAAFYDPPEQALIDLLRKTAI